MQLSALPWDLGAILLLLGVVVPWHGAVRVRSLLARPALSFTDRIAIYATTIVFQWVLCGVTAWRCLVHGWSLRSLGISLDNRTMTLGIGLALASILALMQLFGLRQLRRMPPSRRGRISEIARKLMPQNLSEALPFVALVCTVSLCEEFLYRGFIFSAFERVFRGSVGAAILGSSILFAIAHLYQGRRGVISTFLLGAAFAGVRVWAGSLAPSILGHLAVDLTAGLAGSRWGQPEDYADIATEKAGDEQGFQ
jgi:CAAX protease family protein